MITYKIHNSNSFPIAPEADFYQHLDVHTHILINRLR